MLRDLGSLGAGVGCVNFFFQWEKAIFNYLISQRNPQRLSKSGRNWNSFSKGFAPGESAFADNPRSPSSQRGFSNLLENLEKKKARTRGICNLWESDFIWRLGGGFGTPVVPRRGRLGPHTLERKNFGFSKMIDLVGKIWLRNFNVVLWNF